MPLKHLHVACAVLLDDQNRLLAVQRSTMMSLPLMWELPGGKIEPNEDAQTCIVREIKEELSLDMIPIACLPEVDFRYPDFEITLYPVSGSITDWTTLALSEHAAYDFLTVDALMTVDWAPADIPILHWIKNNML